MKIVAKEVKEVKKFQQGGAMAPVEQGIAPEQAPAQGGGSPEEMMNAIIQGAQEAVQTGNGELALEVCTALVEMVGSAQGAAPQEAPVYQKCGGKMKKKKSSKK